ncbi:MAG: SPASM domain-containing protein [Culicoidibacterales bacterium]
MIEHASKSIIENTEVNFYNFIENKKYYRRTEVSDIISTFFSKEAEWYYNCEALVEMISIDPNGDVWPCHLFVKSTDYKIGNVLQENFQDIERKIEQSALKFHENNKENLKCKGCEALFWCQKCKRICSEKQQNNCETKKKITIEVLDLIAKNEHEIDHIVQRVEEVLMC